jgi:prophage regulatory protein
MTQPPRRFLRLPAVKHQVGLGRTALYQKIKVGEFPAPYPLSANGRAVAWNSEEIDAWIDSRIQAAGGAK